MTEPKSPEHMRDIILQSLDDNKAEDIVSISLQGKTTIADYMIIASGRSSRHVVGLSGHITDDLAKAGMTKVKFEGKDNGDWVLGDAGDVIIHLFRPEVREFYNIEKIWCDPEFLESYEATRDRQKDVEFSVVD
jgi:ribosome-associated protein